MALRRTPVHIAREELVTGWRRFELLQGAETEYREIRQEGIRCFLRWGGTGTSGKAGTSTLDDEQHAGRHASRKINEWLRKGFTEVARPFDVAELDQQTRVLDVIKSSSRSHAPVPEYLPIDGFEETYHRSHAPGHPMGFHEYFVLRDQGRSAVRFTVRGQCHDPATVSSFLAVLCTRRDLPFGGQSHHKVPLSSPVGPFTHALFCAPALGQACIAYPAIAARVATAFPIFDCEIGDADTEVLVDARIRGHGALPCSDWSRPPQPVVDLRFDVQPSNYRRTQTFKVFGFADLKALLDVLPTAAAQSWLEVRSFRGETRRFTPGTTTPFSEVTSFLHG
ncbi:WGR domain-containing protein [Streptomyces sp. MI02-7b]|uniref:WGR domain-containing protein n=1 Tax=Streptomyces sp. MI02-7b TaxID=462941 RepID=UPI0029BCEA97|nr:WGR domain-containing protein [Streptomyces sp. MI02-7b]MDX3074055.1 WGR domain-containing protein [Streptomyces sp. MI02-7b]